ncbi:MAG: FAD-dependent oxidoreductase, partial [Proteiniphilum sp.]|nr:FAD-dependent oxidoreductase [Proteiniphilum sp.]
MKKKIVVVGCGFGGLQFVNHLPKGMFDIMVIDKINHHQFPPLFYQVAASQIEPATISFPIRKLFQKRRDVRIRLAQVLAVNAAEKVVETSIGPFAYDYLVIATGTRTNFYGNAETERNALGLKSTYQSINVRNFILNNFEKLLYTTEKEPLYNIVIVGGGATGVELAGAFAEMTREVLPKDYPNIDSSRVHVYLLEGSEHTLSAMSRFAQ